MFVAAIQSDIGAGLGLGLTSIVLAPTLSRAGGGQSAGIILSGRHLGIRAGLIGRLAEVIVPPAVNRTIRAQAAGVLIADDKLYKWPRGWRWGKPPTQDVAVGLQGAVEIPGGTDDVARAAKRAGLPGG